MYRSILTTLSTLILALAPFLATGAQEPATGDWEFRISSGALMGTGAQRTQLSDAQLTALQLSWTARERLALTGTFSWGRSRDLLATDTPRLDVFTTDLGAELRSAAWRADQMVSLSAFVGLGAGARSYNHRKSDLATTTNIAGYGSVGGEVGIGRVGVRLEARGYAAGFKPFAGVGAAETRSDIVIMGALRFNRRRAALQ